MSQFNNQMTVKIRKDYSWVEYNDTMQACRNLNGAAFKIYIYFSSYCNGDTVDFSPRQVSNELGININTARNAFNELITKKYLNEIMPEIYIFTGVQKI